jgi:hypothetical protein
LPGIAGRKDSQTGLPTAGIRLITPKNGIFFGVFEKMGLSLQRKQTGSSTFVTPT